ncbi:hypothetical protein D3C73_818660 [compost metagenome]
MLQRAIIISGEAACIRSSSMIDARSHNLPLQRKRIFDDSLSLYSSCETTTSRIEACIRYIPAAIGIRDPVVVHRTSKTTSRCACLPFDFYLTFGIRLINKTSTRFCIT